MLPLPFVADAVCSRRRPLLACVVRVARVVSSSTSGETVRELALVRGARMVPSSTSGETVRELTLVRGAVVDFGS